MKDNRKTIQLLLIFTVIFSIMGGSLAYWNWNTTEAERTNVVFTVTSDFSCAADGGGNITSNDVSLAPTTCTDTSRAIKRKVTVTPTLNRETMTLSMDLWLTINDLGEGLKKSNNFRYVLTTSENSCEEGTIMASGNFKGRKVGNKVNLLTNELYVETPTEPEEYYLYIWLDAEETSSSTMNQTFSLSLGGQCEEVETLVGDAYALYTESDTTLTFVRSETPITAGSEYGGKVVTSVYSGIEEYAYTKSSEVPWNSYASSVTSISFEDEIRPISTAYWFANFLNCTSLNNLSYLNTMVVTNMNSMFSSLGLNDDLFELTLDLSSWDTSKVKNMNSVFGATNMNGESVRLNLSGWDTSNVNYMSGMFGSLGEATSSVTIIGIDSWDTSNVTDMDSLFNFTCDIGTLDMPSLSNWNTSNVTDMSSMFFNAGSYSGDYLFSISTWDTSSVINMNHMFYNVQAKSDGTFILDLGNWDVSNVTNMSNMFNVAGYGATTLSLGNISNWDTSNVTDMSGMFANFSISSSNYDGTLDLSGWDVSNVIKYSGFSYGSVIIPPIWKNGYFKVYSETDYSLRIYNGTNMPSVGDIYNDRVVTKVHNISAGSDGNEFYCNTTTIVPTSIVVVDNVKPYSLDSWFSGCTKVNYVDVTKLDVSNVSNMSYMFRNVGSDSSVTSFTILGLDKWNTSNVTSMSNIFYNMGLNADYTLDLSGWDVSKVYSWGHSNFDYGVESKIIDPLWN